MNKRPRYKLTQRTPGGAWWYSFFYPPKVRHRGTTGQTGKKLATEKVEKIITQTIRLITEDGLLPEHNGAEFDIGAYEVQPGAPPCLTHDAANDTFDFGSQNTATGPTAGKRLTLRN